MANSARWCVRGVAVLALAAALTAWNAPVSYFLEPVAGGDYAGDGGPATLALLVQTEGVAVDTRGNLYVADAGDHRVRRISPAGVISTVAGNGRPGFSGDGGPAANAQLRTPYGVAADRNGNLYVADLGNARVRKISADGTISTVAGGGVRLPSDGTNPTEVALTAPRNVAVDVYGTLHFSDFGAHRVYQIRESGALGIVAGTGQPGFAGDGGPAVKAQLNSPAGLAADPAGNLFIADTVNARVRKVWRGVITTLGDGGSPGAEPSIPLRMPAGLTLDPDGSLFIADIGGNQLLRVTPLLSVTPVAQPARDIVIDSQGNLYACSGPLVYKRARFGGPILVAGSMAGGYIGDGASSERARFQQPGALARDLAGNLYVADTGNHRIRKITPDGAVLTVAGNGLPGFSGDGGPAIAAKLASPSGVAVDGSGNVFVADTGNDRVRKVDPSGVIQTVGTFATPTWLAVDHHGVVFVSELRTHSVRTITPEGVLGTAAGNGSRGFTGDGGPAVSASLDTPQGLAVDPDGNLFIADSGNRRIRRVSAPNGYGPSLITTVPDMNAAIWRGLRGIAVSPDGRLFVTDTEDSRLFRVDGPGQVLAVAGNGSTGFSGESGPALSLGLNGPAGITVDVAGYVYFVDSGNNRIRKLTPVIEAPENPPPSMATIVSAATLLPGPVAPGQILSIFGESLGSSAGGTIVLFNGAPAPLFYVSDRQINLQAPGSIAGSENADVEVIHNGILRLKTSVPVAEAVPGIFTVSGGAGQAAALNEDGSYNNETNPIPRGSVIVLFATGEGKTNPNRVSVRIGGYSAVILYAGPAPGFPGLMQINARIPIGFLGPGNQSVTLQVGSAVSPPGVTVALK